MKKTGITAKRDNMDGGLGINCYISAVVFRSCIGSVRQMLS